MICGTPHKGQSFISCTFFPVPTTASTSVTTLKSTTVKVYTIPETHPKVFILGNTTCQVSAECRMQDISSVCIDGVCKCGPGFWPISAERCMKYRLGDNCDEAAQCEAAIPSSTCWDGICLCLPQQTCNALVITDILCSHARQCLLHSPNTECFFNRCRCRDGYTLLPDKKTCVPQLLPGLCRLDSQCQRYADKTQCTRGLCLCWSNTLKSYNLCPSTCVYFFYPHDQLTSLDHQSLGHMNLRLPNQACS